MGVTPNLPRFISVHKDITSQLRVLFFINPNSLSFLFNLLFFSHGIELVGITHRSEKVTNVSEDAGPRKGWIVMSHIGWRG